MLRQHFHLSCSTLRFFTNIFAENYLQMSIQKTYIQQLNYDGQTYTKGSVVDLLEKFHIGCLHFPFNRNPKPKDLPTRDWAGEDGLDVYVPETIPMAHYDMEVTFLYVRNTADNGNAGVTGETEEQTRDRLMRQDIGNFIDFLYGRIKGDSNDTVQSGRLAIYDEKSGIGRKDVIVSEVENELFYASDNDSDIVARFKVKFTVYDPTTDVTPATGQNGIIVKPITTLNFEVPV